MYELYLVLVICVLIFIEVALLRRRENKELERVLDGIDGVLPPGTMGFPILGETLEFAKKKIGFFKERHQQYGSIFKTHLFGKPTIRVYGAENIRKVIQGENKLVQASYPRSVKQLLGKQSMTQAHGETHRVQKLRLMSYLSPEFLQRHIPIFAETIRNKFVQWSAMPSVNLFVECRKLFLHLAAKHLIRTEIAEDEIAELRKQFDIFSGNLFVLPIYCPGFGYYKAFQAKQRVREIIVRILNRPTFSPDEVSTVFGEYQRTSSGDLTIEKDCEFLDSVIELLFFGAESVNSTGFSMIHQLSKNEKVLEKLHSNIQSSGIDGDLCMHDLQEVPYTDDVINETMRMFPPIGGFYREVLQTFELEGYTVPKGWKIAIGIRDTHQNDKTVDEVTKFNPDRWAAQETRGRYSYLPFGGGIRVCPGRLYAKTVLRVFAIEFAKQFRSEIVEDSDICYWPVPQPETRVLTKIVMNTTSSATDVEE